MSQKQDELFLWVWERRRRAGRLRTALIGLAIGALGGLLFTILMFGFGGEMQIAHDAVPPALRWATRFGAVGFMLVLAVPAFGGLGAVLADRVYQGQEAQYHAIRARGVAVPETKPQLTLAERGPMLAVLIAVLAIMAFIAFVTLAV